MIVFASSLRHVRRPRRIPSVAAVVRALGTVQVTDQPIVWPYASQAAPRTSSGTSSARDRDPAGASRRTG